MFPSLVTIRPSRWSGLRSGRSLAISVRTPSGDYHPPFAGRLIEVTDEAFRIRTVGTIEMIIPRGMIEYVMAERVRSERVVTDESVAR